MTAIATSRNLFDTAFYNMPLEVQNKGHWELDLQSNHLLWSDYQYKIYGYKPHEININDGFFILKTTHCSEVNRITKIINDALKEHEGYNFKRRIIRKNGSIGFVETNDQQKDVFLHISVLRRLRKETLGQGQRVRMKIVDSIRGREARDIELL